MNYILIFTQAMQFTTYRFYISHANTTTQGGFLCDSMCRTWTLRAHIPTKAIIDIYRLMIARKMVIVILKVVHGWRWLTATSNWIPMACKDTAGLSSPPRSWLERRAGRGGSSWPWNFGYVPHQWCYHHHTSCHICLHISNVGCIVWTTGSSIRGSQDESQYGCR